MTERRESSPHSLMRRFLIRRSSSGAIGTRRWRSRAALIADLGLVAAGVRRRSGRRVPNSSRTCASSGRHRSVGVVQDAVSSQHRAVCLGLGQSRAPRSSALAYASWQFAPNKSPARSCPRYCGTGRAYTPHCRRWRGLAHRCSARPRPARCRSGTARTGWRCHDQVIVGVLRLLKWKPPSRLHPAGRRRSARC